MQVEERLEEAFLLVVRLEELLREATLFGSQVQNLAIVELAAELLSQFLGDYAASRADLPAHVDDDMFIFHTTIPYVVG